MTLKGLLWRGRGYLPLVLAALTAAVLVVLPPKLSAWEDGRRAGVVHRDALPEDRNFPPAPPELPGRVRLLARWRQDPGSVMLAGQSLEDPQALGEARALMEAELEALAEAGVLPEGLPEPGEAFMATRLYLRDLGDLSSAGFLELWATDRQDYDLAMTLDLETGRALFLRLTGPAALYREHLPAEAAGEAFLRYLRGDGDLSWERAAVDGDPKTWKDPELHAAFTLSGCRYQVLSAPGLLAVSPELEEDTDVSAEPPGKDR